MRASCLGRWHQRGATARRLVGVARACQPHQSSSCLRPAPAPAQTYHQAQASRASSRCAISTADCVITLPQTTCQQMCCASRPSFALFSWLLCQAADSACSTMWHLGCAQCLAYLGVCLRGACSCCSLALVSAACHSCSAPQPHLAASARQPAAAAPAQRQQPLCPLLDEVSCE